MRLDSNAPKLSEILPGLSLELKELLLKQGELVLAAQVPELRIIDRCRCGDDFCGSFYVQPRPEGSYGPSHRNIGLSPEEGMLILDVVDSRIVYVEVLCRDEVRRAVEAAVP